MVLFFARGRSPTTAHTFHIPVLGIGFTVDTPLRVARYGISSVVSLGDDLLLEHVRRHYCEREGLPFEPADPSRPDVRAVRTRAYLDLLDVLVARQVAELQQSPFEPGSEITRYFELLPDGPDRTAYAAMLAERDPVARLKAQEALRMRALPGSIDVNIMTKSDRDLFSTDPDRPSLFSDAVMTFRGFAESTLSSSVVLSAGINPRLFASIPQYEGFFPDAVRRLKKRIVLKVSDVRSAVVQSKFLVKRGVWVSELRVESGLNCGGHAFSTQGSLLGPVLEEFRAKRTELVALLHEAYAKALRSMGRTAPDDPLPMRVTAQGGIGTPEEDLLLRRYYDLDGTGWGTPWLLVPEVTNVDDATLERLVCATEADLELGQGSPFGLPFWMLKTSASEELRRRRIAEGRPGAPCSRGLLRFNTDFTKEPVCTASRAYQRLRLARLGEEELNEAQRAALRADVEAKACICKDLSGAAAIKLGLNPVATPTVCPGPGIVDFSRIATLEEMVGHIYGRLSLITNRARPHMFIRELRLNLGVLRQELERRALEASSRTATALGEFQRNLLEGVQYYRKHATEWLDGAPLSSFLSDLEALGRDIAALQPATA
ncbi:MAG: hypothetical protein LAO05_14990 [Acidobacteriia bacterium]|nr:hypothetical protein [Terriglobia bacterium]